MIACMLLPAGILRLRTMHPKTPDDLILAPNQTWKTIVLSIAQPARRFHCHITRVSTNKGDGSRFCVTNSLELPYVLPAVEENRQVEHHEEEEEEDEGYGAESASEKKRKKDAESKAKRRVSWVERIALQKAKREQDAEEDRKRRIAMERRERGDDSDSNSHDKYGIREEDSSLETAEETESEETESESGISEQSKLHKNDEAGSSEVERPLEVRRLELPSVLLTWEPSSKILEDANSQLPLMFFLAAGAGFRGDNYDEGENKEVMILIETNSSHIFLCVPDIVLEGFIENRKAPYIFGRWGNLPSALKHENNPSLCKAWSWTL